MARRCPHCGYELEMIEVHGHGQCRVCGVNIEPCCQGAPERSCQPIRDEIDRGRGDSAPSRVS